MEDEPLFVELDDDLGNFDVGQGGRHIIPLFTAFPYDEEVQLFGKKVQARGFDDALDGESAREAAQLVSSFLFSFLPFVFLGGGALGVRENQGMTWTDPYQPLFVELK